MTGPLHDEVEADQREWLGLLETVAGAARERGELGRGTDPKQLAFEVAAAMDFANLLYILLRDPAILDRGRTAVGAAIRAASAGMRSRSAPSRRRSANFPKP
jgi:hypothetical protein